MIRTSSPTRNSAGHTRLPTFSITSTSISSSGSGGSAERTMFASRWHSPPKPAPVLSWTTGMCSMRQPVGVERALHVALQHADADAVRGPQHALEQRRLARPGRAHQVHDVDAGPVEVVAVGARDRVVGVQRVLDDPDLHPVHAGSSSTSMDSSSSSSPAATVTSDPAARRAAEDRHVDLPLAPARRAAPAGRRDHHVVQRRALAHGVARDDVQVEVERIGHDLAQPADAQPHVATPPAPRHATAPFEHRGGDRELMHASSAAYASSVCSSPTCSSTTSIARSITASTSADSPTPRLLDRPGLAGDDDDLAREAADGLTKRSTVCGSIPCGLIISPSSIGRE